MSESTLSEERLWEIRAYIYRTFADMTRAPSVEETAAKFRLKVEQAVAAYLELHRRHAFFLNPGTHEILMANPFSNVETPFHVYANGKKYFANCAWDSLGIPAALRSDADVGAVCSQSGEKIVFRLRNGAVSGSDALVYFLVPFRQWYADLVFT